MEKNECNSTNNLANLITAECGAFPQTFVSKFNIQQLAVYKNYLRCHRSLSSLHILMKLNKV